MLVKKYHQVMQRYYVQYLSGYDAVLLNQLIQNLAMCPEDESVILTSFSTSVSALSVRQGQLYLELLILRDGVDNSMMIFSRSPIAALFVLIGVASLRQQLNSLPS